MIQRENLVVDVVITICMIGGIAAVLLIGGTLLGIALGKIRV
jgi:hypothetical protein